MYILGQTAQTNLIGSLKSKQKYTERFEHFYKQTTLKMSQKQSLKQGLCTRHV